MKPVKDSQAKGAEFVPRNARQISQTLYSRTDAGADLTESLKEFGLRSSPTFSREVEG